MKRKCLKETQNKISPNTYFSKRDYLPLYQEGIKGCVPHFSKGRYDSIPRGRGGIFHVDVLNNEKGIALFMVLVLSVILLSITAAVLYMVIEGTQSSGREKRYKTALEASQGGLDISYELISTRGNSTNLDDLKGDLLGRTPVVTTPATCKANNAAECLLLDDYDSTYTGITTKLRLPTSIGTLGHSCWTGCDSTLTIDPAVPASYDMSFKLGGIGREYDVFVKIVDSTIGNSGAPTGLVKTGVVLSNSGEITVPKIDYLYTIEVLSQAQDNPNERARAEVLYGY